MKNINNNSINSTKNISLFKTRMIPNISKKFYLKSSEENSDEKTIKNNLSATNALLQYKQKNRHQSLHRNTKNHKIILKNYFVNFQMPLIPKKGINGNGDDDALIEKDLKKVIKPFKTKAVPKIRNKCDTITKQSKLIFHSDMITLSPVMKKNLTISTIIAGRLSNLSIGVINENYKNYAKPIKSNDINSTDYIKAFAAHTYQGLNIDRNYNKILVILKVSQPERKLDQEWPCCSIFGLFDGMDGDKCSEYLKNELHQYIMKENMFPRAMDKAMIEGYEKADLDFLKSTINTSSSCHCPNQGQRSSMNNGTIIDQSGSCALEIFFMSTIPISFIINYMSLIRFRMLYC